MSYPFFNDSEDLTVKSASFWGQLGWFAVPNGWYSRTDSKGIITASPNADFSLPTHVCRRNEIGTLVFQDLGRSILTNC